MSIRSFTVVTALLLWSLSPPLVAQGVGDPVILSDRVGEYLDASERTRFGLFQSVEGFHGARVFFSAKSGYVVVFEIQVRDGTIREEIRNYSEQVLTAMGERIDHYEELIRGTYLMGSDPPLLKVLSGTRTMMNFSVLEDSTLPVKRKTPDPLLSPRESVPRFTFWPRPDLPQTYPQFGLTVGLGSNDIDDEAIWRHVGEIEDAFRRTGFGVRHHAGPSENPLFQTFGILLLFSHDLGASLECTFSTGTIRTTGVGFGVRYVPAFLESGVIRMFCFGGVHVSRFSLDLDLGYGNQVSPADTAGRYMVFDRIRLRGAVGGTNLFGGAGVEIGHVSEFLPSLSLFFRYQAGSSVAITSEKMPASFRTSSLVLGASFTLYFEGSQP